MTARILSILIRSAPEVNLDGYYTHASDVWAFGIMAWELYVSFISGEDLQPYYHLPEDQVKMISSTTVTFLTKYK